LEEDEMTLLTPHAVDAVEDKAALSALGAAAARLRESSVRPQMLAGDQLIALPVEVTDAVLDLLERFARGESVVIASSSALLTTSQVADFLGVSRTFVIHLIDDGKLGVEYRGTHRRVSLMDAVRYLDEAKRDRRAKLDAIAELTARTGGYDGDTF
jgi:excisionase family DNA binding protein